jgi:hypothetical protein
LNAEAVQPHSRLRLLPFILLLVASIWALATWFHREYTHDDFFFAYFSWVQTTDLVPFRDYYVPSFAVLPQIAEPLFRWFPDSFVPLDVARAGILVCIAMVSALIYAISRGLGTSPPWAAMATLLWLCHPDVVLRMADVRTDAIAALFLLGCAAAVLCVEGDLRVAVICGICFGLALVVSIKTCLAAPFLMLAMIARMRWRAVVPLLLLGLCAAGVLLADYAWNIHVYGLQTFLNVSKDFLGSVRTGHGGEIVGAPVFRFLTVSPVTAVLLLTGLAGFMKSKRGLLFTALAGGYIALTIVINPFLFPYNSLLLIPLLAPIAAGTEGLFKRSGDFMEGIVLGAAALLAFSYGAIAAGTVTSQSNARQKDLVRWMWRSTAPTEHVFDWQGVHFGRPGIMHWWNYTGLEPKYLDGWYSVESELRKAHVTLAIDNYRLRWMTLADQHFFLTHYVHFAPCLFAPGAFLSAASVAAGSANFETFVPGLYRVLSSAPVAIDGAPANNLVSLRAGVHAVSAIRPVDVALYYTTPLREGHPPPCPAADDALIKGFEEADGSAAVNSLPHIVHGTRHR